MLRVSPENHWAHKKERLLYQPDGDPPTPQKTCTGASGRTIQLNLIVFPSLPFHFLKLKLLLVGEKEEEEQNPPARPLPALIKFTKTPPTLPA